MSDHEQSPKLSKLQRAISKVKFLLNFKATQWIFGSVLGRSPSRQRRLSFKSRPSGLLDCVDSDEYYETRSSLTLSRSTSLATSKSISPSSNITRSTSLATSTSISPSSRSSSDASDDVDRRADEFIANFYKQLRMERQVSLELRYCRRNDLERKNSE